MSSSLRQWMQKHQVFDKDLMRLWPKYGINDPDTDLQKLSEDKWDECKTILLSEKRAELKDNATRLRFEKKLTKITKIWKEERKKKGNNTEQTSKPRSSLKKRASASTKRRSMRTPKTPVTPLGGYDVEELRMENRKLRRELSSKNSDYNRIQQDFNSYKLSKENEIKKLNQKYNSKNEEYNKLLKNYQQIQQRMNSKYHDKSAKDKEIDSLKTDKSALLNDINKVMTDEQHKYDKLLTDYNELKDKNEKNLQYKLKYRKEKKKRKTQSDMTRIKEIDIKDNNTDSDDNGADNTKPHEFFRSKKFKPSRERRAKARQRSEILAAQRIKELENTNV